ncbi:MAG: flagellar filament capping protein FliD [Melioribacteraceae bacterium]
MNILSTQGINKLVSSYGINERFKRVHPLQLRKNKFTDLSKVWNDLSSKLTSLKSNLSSLKDNSAGNTFAAKSVELSNKDYFTATATSSASLSSFDIKVNQLAQNDIVMSNTVTASSDSGLSAGTYTIQVASGEFDQNIDITVTGTENQKEMMELIAEAINDATDSTVTASVFSPKDGEAKLTVVSKDKGENNAITIKDVTGSVLSSIGLDFSSRTITVGNNGGYSHELTDLNSKLTLNGIAIERSSNAIDDLISGVTLSLKSAMDESVPKVNLTIRNNVKEITSDIKEFIKNFNESYKYVKENYKTTEDGKRGVFVGNSSALGLTQSMSKIAYAKVEGIDIGNYGSLSEIGITFNSETGLSISDSGDLEDALESNPDQVADLFTSENGVANKLYDLVELYVGSEGAIANLTDSYDKSASFLSDRIETKETQIDKSSDILRRQYESLQIQLANLLQSMNDYQSLGGLFN